MQLKVSMPKPANCFYLSCFFARRPSLQHRHWAVRRTPW